MGLSSRVRCATRIP